MTGYIQKQFQKYKHKHPSKPQYAPYPTAPHKYGAASDSLKEEFIISEYRKGGLYYGINLKWDYDKRTLDISMPGYI